MAKQDLDRVLAADARVAYRHQIIAHRVGAQIEHGGELLATTDLARMDFTKR